MKDGLREVVSKREFRVWWEKKPYKELAREVTRIVQQDFFWAKLDAVVQLCTPVINVLQVSNTDIPTAGKMYAQVELVDKKVKEFANCDSDVFKALPGVNWPAPTGHRTSLSPLPPSLRLAPFLPPPLVDWRSMLPRHHGVAGSHRGGGGGSAYGHASRWGTRLALLLLVAVVVAWYRDASAKDAEAEAVARRVARLESDVAQGEAERAEGKRALANERASREREKTRADTLAKRLQAAQDSANACEAESDQLKAQVHEQRAELARRQTAVDSVREELQSAINANSKTAVEKQAADDALAVSQKAVEDAGAKVHAAEAKAKAAQDEAAQWRESAERCAAEVQSAAAAKREQPAAQADVGVKNEADDPGSAIVAAAANTVLADGDAADDGERVEESEGDAEADSAADDDAEDEAGGAEGVDDGAEKDTAVEEEQGGQDKDKEEDEDEEEEEEEGSPAADGA